MAVVALNGDERAKVEATPKGFSDHRLHGKNVLVMADHVQFAAGNSVNSTAVMGRLPSNAIIHPDSKIYFDAFGTSVTMNIGDLTDDDALATLIDVSSAGSADLLEAIGVEEYGKELWELLNYSEDPGGNLDIILKIAGAAVVNTADVFMLIRYT